MSKYDRAITNLNEILGILVTTKNDPIVLKSLRISLYDVCQAIDDSIDLNALVASNNLLVLEEVCNAKSFQLSKVAQSLLIKIYDKILSRAPGYAVRNVITSMIAILTSKITSNNSKECSVNIIGSVMLKRSFDCGSLISDILNNLIKLLKSIDITLKIASFKALNSVIIGGEYGIQDIHSDIIKNITKFISDKNAEIRQICGVIIESIAKFSSGCTSVSADLLLNLCNKCIDDDVAVVQDAFIRALAAIYIEQINAHSEAQEKVKIGLARGSNADGQANSPIKKQSSITRISISKLASVVSSQKKVIEEYTFRTVISNLRKQVIKPTPTSSSSTSSIQQVNSNNRSVYISLLGYIINESINELEKSEIEWLLTSVISILNDPVISSLTYDDIIYIRTRLSHVFRSNITYNLVEALQVVILTQLTNFIASIELRSEHELQFAFNEIMHLIQIVGESAGTVADDIHMAITVHLRHSNFNVRSSAAYVLLSLAIVVPSLAARFVSNSMTNAQSQVKFLTTNDPSEFSGNAIVSSYDESQQNDSNSSKRRNPKENERVQRMYCFHGHTLVISILVLNEKTIFSGFPKTLIDELFQFGLDLLQQDILLSPSQLRHITCSLVRAGSLIISSCLNLGYNVNKFKFYGLLTCCDIIIKKTLISVINNEDDLLYELMSVEAALVCLSTVLCLCPDALLYEKNCTAIIVDNLEIAYRAIKGKYQPKFRTNFRFRTLHVILLECYAWLPSSYYLPVCQQMFVEALRVFRDCISSSQTCTCLNNILPPDYDVIINYTTLKLLNPALNSTSSYFSYNPDIPINEQAFQLKLEQFTSTLQKKENEAFLGIFGKDNYFLTANSDTNEEELTSSIFNLRENWYQPVIPSLQIDSRTINSSIMIIASAFNHQTYEIKVKAVQLFSHAITSSLANVSSLSSSSSLFSSDDDKRKKEKKSYVTLKNVITVLTYIVRVLPISFNTLPDIVPQSFNSSLANDSVEEAGESGVLTAVNDGLSWFQVIVDRLIDVLGYAASHEIRSAAAFALDQILAKISCEDKLFLIALIEGLFIKIQNVMMVNFDKKNENMGDYSGYVLAISGLWRNTAAVEDSVVSIPDSVTFLNKRPSLRDRLSTFLLDCLRRTDTSITFRTYGMMGFYRLLEFMEESYLSEVSSNLQLDRASTLLYLPLTVNICTVLDIHASSASSAEDFEQLYISIIKVLGILTRLTLRIWRTSSITEFRDVALVSCKLWDSLSGYLSINSFLIQEGLHFVELVLPYLYLPVNGTSSDNSTEVEILSKKNVFSIINDAIDNRSSQTYAALTSVVECISILTQQDSDAVLKAGFDIRLFVLLDWVYGTSPANINISYSGIEFRTSFIPNSVNASKFQLKSKLKAAIVGLLNKDISKYPNQRISYWLLFFRAVGLNIRLVNSGNDDENDQNQVNGISDEIERDGDDDIPAPTISTSSKVTTLSVTTNLEATSILTYQQFTSKFRDYIINRTQTLPPTRIQIKEFVISCANIALNHLQSILHSESEEENLKIIKLCHLDLKLAREYMNSTFHEFKIASSVNISDTIVIMPVFSIFYLNDFVNFACAMASFTVNDKRLLNFQSESIQFLDRIVCIYNKSIDPDVLAENVAINSQENRILYQFVSQLLSALRPAFSEAWLPALQMSSCNMLCVLLQSGFLTDKVAIKRLAKAMFSVYFDSNVNSNSRIALKREVSVDVSSEISSVHHIVGSMNIAKLYLLSTFPNIDKEISSTLMSMFNEYIIKLIDVWLAISYDSTRFVFMSSYPNSYLWPMQNHDTDLKRGGLTFDSFMNVSHLSKYYHKAFPIVLSAGTIAYCSHYLTKIKLQANSVDVKLQLDVSDLSLFVILDSFLCHFYGCDNHKYSFENDDELIIILSSLSKLAELSNSDISLEKWANLLISLLKYEFLLLSKITSQSLEVYNVISKLLHNITKICVNSIELIRNSVLVLVLRMLPSIFSQVFMISMNEQSENSSDLFGIQHVLVNEDLNVILNTLLSIMEDNQSIYALDSFITNVINTVSLLIEPIESGGKSSSDQNLVNYGIDVLLYLYYRIAALWTFSPIAMKYRSVYTSSLSAVLLNLCKKSSIAKEYLHSRILLDLFENRSSTLRVTSSNGITPDGITGNYVEYSMKLWKEILLSFNIDSDPIPLPVSLIAILIDFQPQVESSSFKQFILQSLLTIIQSDRNASSILLPHILPTLLILITSSVFDSYLVNEIEFSIVQILFVVFSLLDDVTRKIEYMNLILNPMCRLLHKGTKTASDQLQSLETASMQLIAKALTHIAKSNPEILRESIMKLADSDRLLLQTAMKLILTQQNPSTGNFNDSGISSSVSQSIQQVNANSSTSMKKLDFNKFKK